LNLHPAHDSGAASDWSRPLILICNEGFQSSLAAATLHRLGLVNATDLAGGIVAWAAASLPLVPTGPASAPAPVDPDRGEQPGRRSRDLPRPSHPIRQ
jgi:3-mercaptopyruvate sulfurtransferase SseA